MKMGGMGVSPMVLNLKRMGETLMPPEKLTKGLTDPLSI